MKFSVVNARLFSSFIKVKNYPKDLFLIPQNSSKYAVSFLPDLKSSSGIIGWVDARKNLVGDNSLVVDDINPAEFTENKEFETLLHKVIAENIPDDKITQSFALHQKEGWLNINDSRVFSHWGRVSDPEDIFGSIMLEKGVMIPGSYQRMPTHRFVSLNGLFQTSDFIHEKLLEKIKS
ncbi:hypothetical protein HK098_003122 [Nowakowskiella sp. JEL0407]|nr:hypothetical protein HK098_003122 [Nowakowskiella sp. JEL0407]